MGGFELHPYSSTMKGACLAVFDSNVPEYFAPHEREDFEAFLAAPRGRYLVASDRIGQLRGCGGYGLVGDEVVMCWGMVHRDHHRRGIGRALLEERLRGAGALYPTARRLRLTTSHAASGFYARHGFVATDTVVADGLISMTRPAGS